LADSIVKRSRYYRPKGFEPIRTWELLLRVVLYPSLSERLQNLNFEIKERKIEIQRTEDAQKKH